MVVVESGVPAVATEYHATVPPEGAVADSITVPAPHLAPAIAAGAEGRGLMVAKSAVRLADTQPEAVIFAST